MIVTLRWDQQCHDMACRILSFVIAFCLLAASLAAPAEIEPKDAPEKDLEASASHWGGYGYGHGFGGFGGYGYYPHYGYYGWPSYGYGFYGHGFPYYGHGYWW